MITYTNIIFASWLVFILVWGISSLNVKRDKRSSWGSWWQQFWLVRIAAFAIVVFFVLRTAKRTAHYSPSSMFSQTLFVPPFAFGWVAAILTVFGIAFAIWARFYLGRNWSSRPAMKVDHELVTNGPYTYVRHPIYTGILLAALGAALSGSLFA